MIVITSRGGNYSPESPMHNYNLQEHYLRTVFGFDSIADIIFVNAQSMDAMGPEVQNVKIEAAQKKVQEVVSQL